MPDKRKHRGPHPEDAKLFAAEAIGDLRLALTDYSMLLTKGYVTVTPLRADMTHHARLSEFESRLKNAPPL